MSGAGNIRFILHRLPCAGELRKAYHDVLFKESFAFGGQPGVKWPMMNTLRSVVQLLTFIAAACAAVPASAELYKWVDERGVTNYSNEPPPAAATAKKLTRVDSTISIYTPDESFMRAVKALRERSLRKLSEPEPERSPVARMAAPPQSGFEQCVLSGRLGCDDLWGSPHSAYLPVALFLPARSVQPTHFLAPRPPPSRADPIRVSRAPAVR